MRGMKYTTLFGWAFFIYAAMFLKSWVFYIYGFVQGDAPVVAGLFLCVTLSLIAGISLRAQSAFDVMPYSISWALIMMMCDMVLSVPILGWSTLLDWHVWPGYFIVVVVPLVAPSLRRAFIDRGVSAGI